MWGSTTFPNNRCHQPENKYSNLGAHQGHSPCKQKHSMYNCAVRNSLDINCHRGARHLQWFFVLDEVLGDSERIFEMCQSLKLCLLATDFYRAKNPKHPNATNLTKAAKYFQISGQKKNVSFCVLGLCHHQFLVWKSCIVLLSNSSLSVCLHSLLETCKEFC